MDNERKRRMVDKKTGNDGLRDAFGIFFFERGLFFHHEGEMVREGGR